MHTYIHTCTCKITRCRENNNCRSIPLPVVRPASWLHHPPHTPGYDWHLPAATDYATKVDSTLLTHARGVMEPSKVGK